MGSSPEIISSLPLIVDLSREIVVSMAFSTAEALNPRLVVSQHVRRVVQKLRMFMKMRFL